MIARKSALFIATSILNGALGYVGLYFITRHMSPEDYGIVAFALGFVTLFTIFGNLGYHYPHIKKVSEGKDIGTYIGTFLTIKIGLVGLAMSMAIGALIFWKFVLGRGFETPTHELAIYIMIGYCAVKLLAQIFIVTFRAKKEVAKIQIPLLLETVIRVAVTVYVALAGFGAIALALTYVAGDIVYFLSALYLFRGYPIKKPSFNYFKDYSKFAFPLIIVVASATIMTNIDKVLIQLFWSAADVGYYFSAFRLSILIVMFAEAIGLLLFPTFSTMHINDDIVGIRRLTSQSERYLSMIVFPMVVGMVILAEPAVRILLSGWMDVVPILQILTFFVLLDALTRPYASQFIGINRPKIVRNRVIIMVCCNVFLNIVLIPKDIQMLGLNLAGLGARGAAIATVLSYGVSLVYSRIMAWKLTKTKGNPRVLIHALAAGIMAAILYFILYNLNMIGLITRWYHLVVFSFLGLGIYLGVLLLLREFTKKDFDFFIEVLNIKKMIQYIKDEIRGK